MASDLVSLADASKMLRVSSERVRQLVVAGDLPGVRFGNSWAVPREAVAARRQVSNRRGRPLGARRAWEAIASGGVDLSNVSRYRNRGELHRYSMSSSDHEFLVREDRGLVSGVAAAAGYGEGVPVVLHEADLYVSSEAHRDLDKIVAAVPDPLGEVAIRVVPEELWDLVYSIAESHLAQRPRFAPRAAVALDLMDSGDPRHWVAASSLVASNG